MSNEAIKPSFGKKRGRMLRTDSGREISHEEVVCGLIKRTAVELTESKTCACGNAIEKPKKGPWPVRCLLCHADKVRKTKGQSGTSPKNTIANDLKLASKHRQLRREISKRKRDKRKSEGLCVQCGKEKAELNRVQCRSCADKYLKNLRKKRKKDVES